ncbi:MAG TPA: phage tail protein [Candidatus Limnocylindrales bacterium]|nr:phage tail protein [Candidatus Limnocylindrales bacterium]
MSDPALSIVYRCTIDGVLPLGVWTKIEGLGFEYDIKEYKEGGVNLFTHKLLGPIKYTNLRLSRPVDSNSQWLAMWLQMQAIKVIPSTMAISALASTGEEITTWNLAGVIPFKWSGPTLDIMGNAIATETLEVVYEQIIGFGALGGQLGMVATFAPGF